MPYADPEKARLCRVESHRRRRAENPEVVKKAVEATRKWKNTEAGKLSQKKADLKKLGWTPEAVETARATQHDRCAICNEIKTLVPDHEHIVPLKPRELLCGQCNSGLGFFKDDPKLCELAASYLRKWGKV